MLTGRACRHCHSPAWRNPCWSRRFGAHEKECVREDREAKAEQMVQDAIAAQERWLKEYPHLANPGLRLRETDARMYERKQAGLVAARRERRRLRWWLYREIFYYATAFAFMGWTIWVIAMTHP